MNRFLLILLMLTTAAFVKADETHLFILSGQSNMKRLDPNLSFTPAVQNAFGENQVIVVMDAEGGQSISRWYRGWKDVKNYQSMEPDPNANPSTIGDLYDRLMAKVRDAITGKEIQTVTFVWMQGEADSGKHHVVYENNLKGLIQQVQDDFSINEMNVVIGRRSDAIMDSPGWIEIRRIQQTLCETNPRW